MTATESFAETYLTPKEVAAKLRLKIETVHKRIRTGRIKATSGHRKLIPSSELARLLHIEAKVEATPSKR